MYTDKISVSLQGNFKNAIIISEKPVKQMKTTRGRLQTTLTDFLAFLTPTPLVNCVKIYDIHLVTLTFHNPPPLPPYCQRDL